jgi:hypothetical protein
MTADQTTCQQIICGAITQAQAGIPLMLDCADNGFVGAEPCNADVCSPWLDQIETNMGGPCPGNNPAVVGPAPVDNTPNPLPTYVIKNTPPVINPVPNQTSTRTGTPTITPTTLLTPLPSITQPHVLPSINPAGNTGFGWSGGNTWCAINTYLDNNPMAALAIVAGAYLLLSGRKGR